MGINQATTPASRFVINHVGSNTYQAYIYNPNISISGGALGVMTEMGSGSSYHIRSITATTNIGSNNYLYGIKTSAFSTTAYSSGRTYGIYAQAGNATSGYNYGVYGYLLGSNNGVAVFGTTSGDVVLSQKWAGYFKGDTKVEGTLWVNSTPYTSDEKFKINISSLESSETISNILKINPIKYNLKQFEVSSSGGDTIKVSKYYDESSQLFVKAKYGVIAQELQEIYPDLVYTDGEGNLGVDYIELVPILIKAVQVQQRNIEALEIRINQLSGK
ncbi:MAG TPA: tail fiber domain-containing protein [Bacteroidales bacterium]|nr:tail fiber domain-containing protein [Bacteroidales bacterium]